MNDFTQAAQAPYSREMRPSTEYEHLPKSMTFRLSDTSALDLQRLGNEHLSRFASTCYCNQPLEVGQMVQIIGMHNKQDAPADNDKAYCLSVRPIDERSTLLDGYAIVTGERDSSGYALIRQLSHYYTSLVPLREDVSGFCGIGRADGALDNNGFGFYVSRGDGEDRKAIKRVYWDYSGVAVANGPASYDSGKHCYVVNAEWLDRTIDILWESELYQTHNTDFEPGDMTAERFPNISTGQNVLFSYRNFYDTTKGYLHRIPDGQEDAAVNTAYGIFIGSNGHLDLPIGARVFFDADYPDMRGWQKDTTHLDIDLPYYRNGEQQTMKLYDMFSIPALSNAKVRIANE